MVLDSKTRSKLRSQAHDLHITINVGKAGITETVLEEMRQQLERRKLVKVGLLRSATHEAGRDPIAEQLAVQTGSELVEVRGNTAVYWKRGSAPREHRGRPEAAPKGRRRGAN